MFTAITEKGSIINLFNMKDKDELKVLRSIPTYCPECKGRVILKMGEKKITHFAHERKEWCKANGEAESSYHLQGKLQLYEKLLQLKLEPQLEPYYSEIKQRADISFIWNNKKYVIEYQCAVISPQLVKKTYSWLSKNKHSPHLDYWLPTIEKMEPYQIETFRIYLSLFHIISGAVSSSNILSI